MKAKADAVELGPTSHTIGEITVPSEYFQVDLELLDRYQAFSSELLRLALAGVAVIGFLITNLMGNEDLGAVEQPLFWFKLLAFGSAVVLCLSAAASLCHRYFATDGVYYHIKAVRLRLRSKHPVDDVGATQRRLEQAVRNRKAIYSFSGRFLFAAAVLLWVGISLLAASFAVALLLMKPPARDDDRRAAIGNGAGQHLSQKL